MPIRPIDMQVMMPKIQKINENKKGIENRQVNAAADQQSENAKKTDLKQKKVDRKETKDNPKVKAQEKREKNAKDQKKKKSKKTSKSNVKSDKKEKDSFSTSKFDMKI